MAASIVPGDPGRPDISRANLPARVRLPRTSTRLQAPRAFCQPITAVRRAHGHFWFEGPICRPGEQVEIEPSLLLECAGPQSRGSGHRRPEVLWILWKWVEEWREVARAVAIGAEWALLLGPLAQDLLRAPVGLHDMQTRARDVADQAIRALNETLERETAAVRRAAWLALYDQIPGRLLE